MQQRPIGFWIQADYQSHHLTKHFEVRISYNKGGWDGSDRANQLQGSKNKKGKIENSNRTHTYNSKDSHSDSVVFQWRNIVGSWKALLNDGFMLFSFCVATLKQNGPKVL